MGLSVSQTNYVWKSIGKGEGDVSQILRAQKLITEMKTSVPDFNQHSSAYTQLAKFLAKDEKCTVDDIVNSFEQIQSKLLVNGQKASDKNILAAFQNFQNLLANDNVTKNLYANTNLTVDNITEILRNCTSNDYKASDLTQCLQDKISTNGNTTSNLQNALTNTTKTDLASQANNTSENTKTDLASQANNVLEDYLNTIAENNKPTVRPPSCPPQRPRPEVGSATTTTTTASSQADLEAMEKILQNNIQNNFKTFS